MTPVLHITTFSTNQIMISCPFLQIMVFVWIRLLLYEIGVGYKATPQTNVSAVSIFLRHYHNY